MSNLFKVEVVKTLGGCYLHVNRDGNIYTSGEMILSPELAFFEGYAIAFLIDDVITGQGELLKLSQEEIDYVIEIINDSIDGYQEKIDYIKQLIYEKCDYELTEQDYIEIDNYEKSIKFLEIWKTRSLAC